MCLCNVIKSLNLASVKVGYCLIIVFSYVEIYVLPFAVADTLNSGYMEKEKCRDHKVMSPIILEPVGLDIVKNRVHTGH